jgi:hypothetical protein
MSNQLEETNLLTVTPSFQNILNNMGLLTILKKVKQKEKELRILILGLDNAGC